MLSNVYTEDELRYFRLAKGVMDYATAALRKVFREEWDYLHELTPWRNDGTSGLEMLAEEQPPSRLLDPKFEKDYQPITDNLRRGNAEEWDITTLNFALLHSQALNGVRDGSRHWKRVRNAIYKIKTVRNTMFAHSYKASIAHNSFLRIFETLDLAMKDLLPTSDPLLKKLKALKTEREFVTEDLVKYKKLLKEAKDSKPRNEVGLVGSVDSVPERFKPGIFHSAKYIRLMNESCAMLCNFQWDEVANFLQGFNDSVDMQIYAGIQKAVSLSSQSRKDESFKTLDSLLPKTLSAEHGVILIARIKIVKAWILHDRGNDDEAMKEVQDAEAMFSLGECPEDKAEIHYTIANILVSSGRNSPKDRESILLHNNKCIKLCEKATVNKSIIADHTKLRKALFHLGYYENGILEEAPKPSEVNTAETILTRVAAQPNLPERNKVFLMYGQSLLAFRKGERNMATKLEHKLRKKCEHYQISFEIKKLDVLRTLIRG